MSAGCIHWLLCRKAIELRGNTANTNFPVEDYADGGAAAGAGEAAAAAVPQAIGQRGSSSRCGTRRFALPQSKHQRLWIISCKSYRIGFVHHNIPIRHHGFSSRRGVCMAPCMGH